MVLQDGGREMGAKDGFNLQKKQGHISHGLGLLLVYGRQDPPLRSPSVGPRLGV
jgi:hypothetical protein